MEQCGNTVTVVKKNGKYGYIDDQGNVISPCIWDYAADFDPEGNPALVFRRMGASEMAEGEIGASGDGFFYYEDYPRYQIDPEYDCCYYPRGYFYVTRSGTVLTPDGTVARGVWDPDKALGLGWLKAKAFLCGSASVLNAESENWKQIDREGNSVWWEPEQEKQYPEQVYLADGKLHGRYRIMKEAVADSWGNCYRVLDENYRPISPYLWSHIYELPDNTLPIRVYRNQTANAQIDGIQKEEGYFFPGNAPSFMQDKENGIACHRGCYFLCRDGSILTLSGPVKSETETDLPDGWEWHEAPEPFAIRDLEIVAFTKVNGHAIAVGTKGKFCQAQSVGNIRAKWFDEIVPVKDSGTLRVRRADRWTLLEDPQEKARF